MYDQIDAFNGDLHDAFGGVDHAVDLSLVMDRLTRLKAEANRGRSALPYDAVIAVP